jgi:hypothetical protein
LPRRRCAALAAADGEREKTRLNYEPEAVGSLTPSFHRV